MNKTPLTQRIVLFFILSIPLNSSANCLCSEPWEPRVPNGYFADYDEMNDAQRDVQQYLDQVQEYKACLVQCLETVNSDAEDLFNRWSREINEFNNK